MLNLLDDTDNLEFRQAPAEKIPLEDGTVDLITTAQAAHWFDLDAFFTESNRLLKPGGVLAIWGYGNCSMTGGEDDAEAKRLFDEVRPLLSLILRNVYYSKQSVCYYDGSFTRIHWVTSSGHRIAN
jgi:ubiquinone/menaquinone biosynthesis C-methylase UbiE